MPKAFVLMNVESGSEDFVLQELKAVSRVEAESMDELKEMITKEIRSLPKVRATLTLIVVEEGKTSQ